MALLLKRPELVNRAVVVDIAPVSYSQRDGGSHNRIIDFMANFDLSQLHSREEVKEAIQQHFRTLSTIIFKEHQKDSLRFRMENQPPGNQQAFRRD